LKRKAVSTTAAAAASAAAAGLAGVLWLLGTQAAWADVILGPTGNSTIDLGLFVVGKLMFALLPIALVVLVCTGAFFLLRRIARQRRAKNTEFEGD